MEFDKPEEEEEETTSNRRSMGTKRSINPSKQVTQEKNKKTNAVNAESKDGTVFASCSFSSLGLHPTLCDELRGIPVCVCVFRKILYGIIVLVFSFVMFVSFETEILVEFCLRREDEF